MQLNEFPFITISQADLNNIDILNDKLSHGVRTGFFYLEIPVELRSLVEQSLLQAPSYYENPQIQNLAEGFSGVHDRKSHQVKSVYLEKKFWYLLTPDDKELSLKMYDIGLDLLKKTLNICYIPESEWDVATGGALEKKSLVHFTINQYRPEKICEGIPEHQDFGQITVLFVNKDGLEARVNGVWQQLPVKENHFIINYGKTLETFVNNPEKLTATWHRVPQLQFARTSMGVFIDNSATAPIYQKEKDGTLTKVAETTQEYIEQSFSKYYN